MVLSFQLPNRVIDSFDIDRFIYLFMRERKNYLKSLRRTYVNFVDQTHMYIHRRTLCRKFEQMYRLI